MPMPATAHSLSDPLLSTSALTAAFLAAAVAAAWCRPLRLAHGLVLPLWSALLAAAGLAGVRAGLLDAVGLLQVALLFGLGWARRCAGVAWARRMAGIAAVALAFAMGLRLLPGFGSAVFAEGVQVSAGARPIRLAFHVDQAVAGLFLLVFFCRRAHTWRAVARAGGSGLLVGLLTATGVIALAVAAGYVRFDPKWPGIAPAQLVKLLLWTAVLEEAFFRGVLQERLSRSAWISARPALRWVPVGVSAVLFGLAHAGGGWLYAALAALAGLGYAVAYAKTRRIESAIAAHFILNAAHFVGFTYPGLGA